MNKFENYSFTVKNVKNIPLEEALQLWKTQYKSFAEFMKNVIIYESLEEFGDFVSKRWSKIKPIDVKEAFNQNNVEKRRLYFDTIGVDKIFEKVNTVMLDTRQVALNNCRWDSDGKMYMQTGIDEYSLFKIDAEDLFGSTLNSWQKQSNTVYAVRCSCTTTGRKYWLYVPAEIGIKGSALDAIAWTCRMPITNPKALYRQGDIFIVEANPDSEPCEPYHLDYKQYSSLIKSQT